MTTKHFSKLILLLSLCLPLSASAQIQSLLPADAVYRQDLSEKATDMINRMYASLQGGPMVSIRKIYTTKRSFEKTKAFFQSHNVALTPLNREKILQKSKPVMVGSYGVWSIMLYAPSTYTNPGTRKKVEETTIVFTRQPVPRIQKKRLGK